MSGIYLYNVDFLPYYHYSIVSTIEKHKIKDHIYEILDRYKKKSNENNSFSKLDIENCSKEINKAINFLELEHHFICCHLITYSFLIFYYENFDIVSCYEDLKSGKYGHDDYVADYIFHYDSWIYINDTEEIDNKILKINIHLDKYLFNIVVDEKYPLNQIVKENFSSWIIEFNNSVYNEFLFNLKLSAVHSELLYSFLKGSKYFKSLMDDVYNGIERMKENIKSEDFIRQKYFTTNELSFKNSISKINFKNISKETLFQVIEKLRNVDDLIEKYGDPNQTNLSTQENIKKTLKKLELIAQYSNFNNLTIKLFFKLYYSILLKIIKIEDVNNKKSWIIHEILQALASDNLNELGLNYTRDGFAHGSYDTFTKLAKMRKGQLESRFN